MGEYQNHSNVMFDGDCSPSVMRKSFAGGEGRVSSECMLHSFKSRPAQGEKWEHIHNDWSAMVVLYRCLS